MQVDETYNNKIIDNVEIRQVGIYVKLQIDFML